jgi:hypothetical protein
MELGKFENSRTFHAPKGNQKVIRDVNPVQITIINPIIPEEEPIIEPTIEIKMSGEPSLDEVIKETPKPKRRIRSKKK